MDGRAFIYIFYWGTHHLTAIAASEGPRFRAFQRRAKHSLVVHFKTRRKYLLLPFLKIITFWQIKRNKQGLKIHCFSAEGLLHSWDCCPTSILSCCNYFFITLVVCVSNTKLRTRHTQTIPEHLWRVLFFNWPPKGLQSKAFCVSINILTRRIPSFTWLIRALEKKIKLFSKPQVYKQSTW